MADIVVVPINEVYMSVVCSDLSTEMTLSEHFSFKSKNQYDARIKNQKWDGIIRLYNRRYRRLYRGLLAELMRAAKRYGYTMSVSPELVKTSNIQREDLESFVREAIRPHSNGAPLEPYDYQYDAVEWMLRMNRSISLAATSAGKSLILYMAARMYQYADEMVGKTIFIIVPNVTLVEQLYSDFKDYSTYEGSDWNVDLHVQKISQKYEKFVRRQIVITTWQSLSRMPSDEIINAGCIMVDEVHTIAGPVLAGMLEMAVNCKYRHGVTGTLDGFEANELAAQGLLGPAKRIVTAKEIIDAGRATPVKVTCVMLEYDEDTCRRFYQCIDAETDVQRKYLAEVNYINALKCRFDFIIDFLPKLAGNTIVMFDRVEDYGLPLYEAYKARHDKAYLIIGDVDAIEREAIRIDLEGVTGAVVFATSAIMSTGTSIKNLHNVVRVASDKSKVRTLQTVGRLMRLHESKTHGNLIDLTDILSYKKRENFTLKHVEERVKYYVAEGHKLNVVKVPLTEAV